MLETGYFLCISRRLLIIGSLKPYTILEFLYRNAMILSIFIKKLKISAFKKYHQFSELLSTAKAEFPLHNIEAFNKTYSQQKG